MYSYMLHHVLLTTLFCTIRAQTESPVYSIPLQMPEDCLTGDDDVSHEYYDMITLSCVPCAQNATSQTVSDDGLSCVCQKTHKREDFQFPNGTFSFKCEPCPSDQEQSEDGYSCITCATTVQPQEECPLCSDQLDITVERELNGSWLYPEQERRCVQCVNSTEPVESGYRCDLCGQTLSVQPSSGCECPEARETGGLCFRRDSDIVSDASSLYTVYYEKDVTVVSTFFRDNIQAAHAACVNQSAASGGNRPYDEYSNLTACQLLGNMCVMTLYSRRYDPPNLDYDACALHLRLLSDAGSPFPPHNSGIHAITEWRANMPWLFYGQGVTTNVLEDLDITTKFQPGMNLTFVAAKYTVEGEIVNQTVLTAEELQMCRDTQRRLSPAFEFGIGYKKDCDISIDNLSFDPDYATYFYDMYLLYTNDAGEEKMYPVPVLLRNYMDNDGTLINEETDRDQWQLVRRFFKVDRVSGVELSPDGTDELAIIRYAKTMVLHITLQSESNQGLIYPPYLEITYDQADSDDMLVNKTVPCSFEVRYSMDESNFTMGVTISISILSALALIYAILRTSTWNKRTGKVALDFVSLLKFLLFVCGALANAFFVVTLGFSMWNFIFYKGQDVFYLVPLDKADYFVRAFLGSAFALKVIQITHIIIEQVIADIFLIDWERPLRYEKDDPHMKTLRQQSTGSTSELVTQLKKDKTNPVSVWRTYFVANEWIELQVTRRVQPVVHMLLVLLLLDAVGLENLTRYEPHGTVIIKDDSYHGEYNLTFRFAVFAMTYILVAFVQRIFYFLILSRFKENPIGNFVDFCSISNISVLLMVNNNYGYYIHGRSPHGHSDVSLRKMAENLKREENDLCGHRGLQSGEEHQTFELAVPRKLRTEYDRVLREVSLMVTANTQTPRASTRITVEMEKKVSAYHVLNRFFQSFLDHNLTLDYIIKNKNFAERMLDSEFDDATFMGIFYIDNGSSFEETILYGQETTLQIFEILLFTMVDIISYNYILAGIITIAVDALIVMIRKAFGKRNVSKKTMVDDRFLI